MNDDVVYYTARTLLVVGWLAVAVTTWRLRARAARPWTGIAIAAVVFASMRAWPWNYLLLDGARAVLRTLGVYDERLGAKVVVGVLLALACLLAVRSLRRSRWATNALACAIAIAAQAGLLAIETMSLDGLLPQLVLAQPGRYLFEGGCVLAALVTALRARSAAWTS